MRGYSACASRAAAIQFEKQVSDMTCAACNRVYLRVAGDILCIGLHVLLVREQEALLQALATFVVLIAEATCKSAVHTARSSHGFEEASVDPNRAHKTPFTGNASERDVLSKLSISNRCQWHALSDRGSSATVLLTSTPHECTSSL